MASERLITGMATLLFGVLSIVSWQDYLAHSAQVYGDRDAAVAQLKVIDGEIAQAQDVDQLFQLNSDRADAQSLYDQAERRINDMDGWNSLEWKVKNTVRLAAPAAAVLFAAFTLLAVLNPLK